MPTKFPLAPVIAHRGVPYRITENTVAGFKLAAELGYQWAELDVQVSSDGVPVLFHDFDLTEGVAVTSLPAADLTRHQVSNQPELFIPTLDQVLATCVEYQLGIVIELKVKAEFAQLVTATAAVINTYPNLKFLLSSFNPAALAGIVEVIPEAWYAINTNELPAVAAVSEYHNVHFNHRHAEPAKINALKEAGHGLYAYTVNDVATYKKLISMGVDGVFTDNPELLDAST